MSNNTVQEKHKLNRPPTTQKSKQREIQQNKTTLVQSPLTTLGQETRRACSTKLLSPHGLKTTATMIPCSCQWNSPALQWRRLHRTCSSCTYVQSDVPSWSSSNEDIYKQSKHQY